MHRIRTASIRPDQTPCIRCSRDRFNHTLRGTTQERRTAYSCLAASLGVCLSSLHAAGVADTHLMAEHPCLQVCMHQLIHECTLGLETLFSVTSPQAFPSSKYRLQAEGFLSLFFQKQLPSSGPPRFPGQAPPPPP